MSLEMLNIAEQQQQHEDLLDSAANAFKEWLSETFTTTDMSQSTINDYYGQYKRICEILETNEINSLFTNNHLSLVLTSLKSKYNDPTFSMGIFSYKKKLDVLKWVNKYLCEDCIEHYSNTFKDFNLELCEDTQRYETKLDEMKLNIKILHKNYEKINNALSSAWDTINLEQSNPQATPAQQETQFHKLQELREKWLAQYTKFTSLMMGFDELVVLKEQCENENQLWLLNKMNVPYTSSNGTTEDTVLYKRTRTLIDIESLLIYGLYIWAPPRRAKDYVDMSVDRIGTPEHESATTSPIDWEIEYTATPLSQHIVAETDAEWKINAAPFYPHSANELNKKNILWLSNDPEIVKPVGVIFNSFKTKKHYGQQRFIDPEINACCLIAENFTAHDLAGQKYWECLNALNVIRDMIKEKIDLNDMKKLYPNAKLFIETNLGNRLKKWSSKYLFDGGAGTTINDIRHLYINDFYNTSRTDEERLKLSKFMGHNVKTQSHYKKDNVE